MKTFNRGVWAALIVVWAIGAYLILKKTEPVTVTVYKEVGVVGCDTISNRPASDGGRMLLIHCPNKKGETLP